MADAARFAHRRLLKAAVFPPQPTASQVAGERRAAAKAVAGTPAASVAAPDTAGIYRTVTGTIIDISPHFITIGDATGERRFALTSEATAWRGAPLEPSALHAGDEAVIRLVPSRPAVADRVWADIGRVTGTIVRRDADRILVADGSQDDRTVVIPPYTSRRIQVRFPNLHPGYLIDLIGVKRQGYLEATVPATWQPPYRADLVRQRNTQGRPAEAIAGSAIWHDSADEPYGVLGVFYPAIDPAAGCVADAAAKYAPGQAPAYRNLPYLAVGTALHVSNECSGVSWTLPVTGCAPTARLFSDHCVTCRRSPRGRVADLTVASFVALGGELEAGCFHASLAIGR